MRNTRKQMVGKIEDHARDEREEEYQVWECDLHREWQGSHGVTALRHILASANGRVRRRSRSGRAAPPERPTFTSSGVLPTRSVNYEDYVPQGDGL